jgi:RecB family endonuclease NucS
MEVMRMSLLGLAITKEERKTGTVYVEYHRCDKCGSEYRVYMKSSQGVEDAFQQLARMFGNKPHEQDICFDCQNNVIAPQSVLSI